MNKLIFGLVGFMSIIPSSCGDIFNNVPGLGKDQETNQTPAPQPNNNQNQQAENEHGEGDTNTENTLNWPKDLVAQEVAKVSPAITTEVPAFESKTYTVAYNSIAHAVAINGFEYPEGIVEFYKQKLESSYWTVSADNDNGYFAISPDEDIKINFYIDEQNNNFSVDVFAYTKPVTGWPEEEINRVLGEEMGVTGVVPPYEGENNGFEVNLDYFPYAIYVFVNDGTQEASASAYNQQIINAGYQKVGEYLGDPVYSQLDTTLGLRAVFLAGNCFTIELFDLTMIFED